MSTTPTSQPDPASLLPRLKFAREIALEAGNLTLDYFQKSNFKIERKSDSSPVTVADREAELLLRKLIAERFPSDAILGEEFPEVEGTSGYRWIVDPIDGTKSFIHGVPLYGNMVAVELDGRGVIGVVNIPALRELVYAAQGNGCWYQHWDHSGECDAPAKCHVSKQSSLADACFVTSEVQTFYKIDRGSSFEKLDSAVRLTRTWGDCYGYMLVATGRADIMVDPKLSVWDAAAVQPIIEEAGGTFTDWAGQPSIHTGNAVATNGVLHEQVLKTLK